MMSAESPEIRHAAPSQTVVDILERVLDKGMVIAGDIFIDLADIQLLRIRLRLVICSVERAQQLGLDWWNRERVAADESPAELPKSPKLQAEVRALREQVTRLERQLAGDEISPV